MQPGQHAHKVRVKLNKLSRSYLEGGRRHTVLQELSAEIGAGEAIALRGRSGSGKSTLLNLISGIDTPDAGEVLIDGHSITAMTERNRTLFRRKNIGFIYQSFNLVPTLTVADNVRLILELNGVPIAAAERRVQELLEAVELPDRGNSYPDVLSGGEQQRVAIARALAHRPLLLLADEPTGNLDDKSAERVLLLIDGLRREHGATLVLATHSSAVASACDRVLELRSGQVSGASD